jgi:superoxide dismutase
MSPTGGGAPAGLLADAIKRDFGSFEQLPDKQTGPGEEIARNSFTGARS